MSSDKEIIELFHFDEKKEMAFNLLLKKYQQKIYWHIRRMVLDHDDTDDVMQNVFIKIWIGLPNFRADSKLFTWIYRIATNETLTFLAQKKRRSSVPLEHSNFDEDSYSIADTLQGDTYFDGDHAQEKLQKAILELPDKQKLVFQMKYYDELTYDQMEEILGTSTGALKASFHHAVKKIEDYLNRS